MKCDNLKVRTVYVDWKGANICYYDTYEVDAAIAELKAKLNESEEARYEAGADAADYYQENCKLKRALWLRRAERANERQQYENVCRLDGWVHRINKWIEVELKCLKKAEEYK